MSDLRVHRRRGTWPIGPGGPPSRPPEGTTAPAHGAVGPAGAPAGGHGAPRTRRTLVPPTGGDQGAGSRTGRGPDAARRVVTPRMEPPGRFAAMSNVCPACFGTRGRGARLTGHGRAGAVGRVHRCRGRRGGG